jgi:2'-hydroxyisoflavone reductase
VRIVVLGGSWFLGRALVTAALEAGHEVTVYNRGRSGPDPNGVSVVRGDRESSDDLARLAAHGPFDAVFDPSGQVPRTVLASARILSEASQYVFISSVSAYVGWPVEPLTEDSELLECPAHAGPDFGADDPRGYPTQYGYLKSGCERAVTEVFGERATLLRPGVILGPYEYVGRLPWWLRRVRTGGRVLAPGHPDQPIQVIDVRDVATFAVHAAERGIGDAYNIAAPPVVTFGSMLEACREATGSDAEFVWVDDDVLTAQGVRQWTELPLWRTFPGTWRVSAERALAAGLTCRPIGQTVADTWAWLESGQAAIAHERAGELGIDPVKEERVISAWLSRAQRS